MLCKWQYYLYVEHVSFVELLNCNNAGRQKGVICPSKHSSAEWGDVATGIKLISIRAGISMAEPSASHPTLLPPSHFSCDSRGHYHWTRKREKDSPAQGFRPSSRPWGPSDLASQHVHSTWFVLVQAWGWFSYGNAFSCSLRTAIRSLCRRVGRTHERLLVSWLVKTFCHTNPASQKLSFLCVNRNCLITQVMSISVTLAFSRN